MIYGSFMVREYGKVHTDKISSFKPTIKQLEKLNNHLHICFLLDKCSIITIYHHFINILQSPNNKTHSFSSSIVYNIEIYKKFCWRQYVSSLQHLRTDNTPLSTHIDTHRNFWEERNRRKENNVNYQEMCVSVPQPSFESFGHHYRW